MQAHALFVLGLVLAFCCFHGSSTTCGTVTYVTPKDVSVAADADSKAASWCEGGFKGEVDKEKGHDNLMKGSGGDNRVLKILKASKSQDALTKAAEEELNDPPWLISKAFALVMSIIMFVIYIFCCWSCLPPCKKICRCCQKERTTSGVWKIIGLVIIAGMGLGIFICAVLAFNGASKTIDGIENFSCTTAKLLNTTLSGRKDPDFIGTTGLLRTFSKLDAALDLDSSFMSQVESSLQETFQIDLAVTEATETLKLMRDTLNLNENMFPKVGSESLHKCELCHQLQSPLTDVINTLESSFASGLNNARGEVKTQLAGDTRTKLQCDMRKSAEPLGELVATIRDQLHWFISEDGFGEVQAQLENRNFLILPAVAAIILGLSVFGCTTGAFTCFLIKGKRKIDDPTKNPYNKCVYRTAAVSWCCGFGYTILFFLVGGLLVAASVPFCGLCLVLEDLNSATFLDVYQALGMDTIEPGTDEWDIAMGFVDQCLSLSHANTSGNLMDIMFVTVDNKRVTMRDKLLTEVVNAVDGKFAMLDNSQLESLASNPEVVKMSNLLSQNPISSFIVPKSGMKDNSNYNALALDSRGQDGLAIGFATSLNCADHTIASNMAPLPAGQTLPGMQTFSSKLSDYGSYVGSNCNPSFSCKSSATTQEQDVCAAVGNFLTLQRNIKSAGSRSFRCDLFTRPNNNNIVCDPADMVQTATGWSGSCAKSTCVNGVCTTSLNRKRINCNLNEFQSYVQKFSTRIDKTFKRVDSTVPLVEDKIKTQMQNYVDTYFLQPIKDVVDGAGCHFLNILYQEMINGLCYQSAWGLRAIGNSYVTMAGLTVIMILLSYMLWRRQIDNANQWSSTEVQVMKQ